MEFKTFGFYLKEHPVSKYRKDYNITSIDVSNNFDKSVKLVLQVSKIKEVITKKNDVMAFVTGVDEFNNVDLTLFPDIYLKYNDIKLGNIV